MSWRRQQGESSAYSHQQRWYLPWAKSQKRKQPPHDHHDSLHENLSSVPHWERKFCITVGSVPWRKLVEIKEYMYSLHKNIVEWNDSAGEEAFNNAKSRFWAQMNGLIPSPDISLPDPDMYIDDIDWDSSSNNINPQLISDLERSKEPKPSNDDHDKTLDPDHVVILGLHPLALNQTTIACTGWGDGFEEKDLKNKENNIPENKENPWEHAASAQLSKSAAAIGGGWDNTTTWNKWDNNYIHGQWKDNNIKDYDSKNMYYYGRADDHGVSSGNFKSDTANSNWKTYGSSWYNSSSRYKTSRFRGNDYYQEDRGWWRKGGRRRNRSVHVGYEKLASCS